LGLGGGGGVGGGGGGGGVSSRGVWGPLKVHQRVQVRALVGGPGGETPHKLWGFEELHTFI
jgi:hypothetical protein